MKCLTAAAVTVRKLSWIVTLDVLKYDVDTYENLVLSWIVTLDVLKSENNNRTVRMEISWIVTLDVLKSNASRYNKLWGVVE